MFDTSTQTGSLADTDPKFQAAMASIQQKQVRKAAAGHAVMAGLSSYGEAVERNGFLGKSARIAQHFLILFTCAVPVYLFATIVM